MIAALVVLGAGAAGAAVYFMNRGGSEAPPPKKTQQPAGASMRPAMTPEAMVMKAAPDKGEQTRLRVARVAAAAKAFIRSPDEKMVDADGCPRSLAELVAAGAPQVRPGDDKDAWARPLVLRCAKNQLCVYSTGPNQQDDQGAGDDIQVCPGR